LALTRFQIGSSDDEAYEAGIERAVAAARTLGDDRVLARALFYLGEGHTTAGRFDEAKAALSEALDAARRAHDIYRETATLQQLAKLYTNMKHFDLAKEHFAAAMRYYKKRGVDRKPCDHARSSSVGDIDGRCSSSESRSRKKR
jgi:tetratricopeptide (TPR) repeat protein